MATAVVPGATNVTGANLTGDMIVPLATLGPQAAQTTLLDMAEYFQKAELTNISNTAIATVGAGTLTAAALKGGLITRSGSTAAYTDTTETAAQLLAAIGAHAPVGTSWLVYIKNTVAFNETLAGGTGVTLSGQTIIAPNSMGVFLLTYSAAAPAFTMVGLSVVPLTSSALLASTALTTVGAGTITAAGIVGGSTTRGGAQSATAFTDTTDTAANIIAAMPNANIGQSFYWVYVNNTDGQATLANGAGVTVTGTGVAKNSWSKYLVTYTAAGTVTIAAVESGQTVVVTPSKLTVGTGATASAGDLTGAAFVNYENNASNATYTTRTGAQMFGDIPNCQIGHSYQLAIRNLNATGLTLTAADGTVTLSGTMTIAQNVTRMFNVLFTSATAVTITSMGISAAGA